MFRPHNFLCLFLKKTCSLGKESSETPLFSTKYEFLFPCLTKRTKNIGEQKKCLTGAVIRITALALGSIRYSNKCNIVALRLGLDFSPPLPQIKAFWHIRTAAATATASTTWMEKIETFEYKEVSRKNVRETEYDSGLGRLLRRLRPRQRRKISLLCGDNKSAKKYSHSIFSIFSRPRGLAVRDFRHRFLLRLG